MQPRKGSGTDSMRCVMCATCAVQVFRLLNSRLLLTHLSSRPVQTLTPYPVPYTHHPSPSPPAAPVHRKQHEPLVVHLEGEGIDFLQFAFRWVNCLLIREVPFRGAIRLWDTYLAEGTKCADFLVSRRGGGGRVWAGGWPGVHIAGAGVLACGCSRITNHG
jgi:hypothetical protein